MRLGILLATAMVLRAGTALAAIDPPAASSADPRMRVVTYNRFDPVELYAEPGASLRIQFGADETVLGVIASDQGTIDPPMVPQSQSTFVGLGSSLSKASKGPASCDPNLCRAIVGNFVYLKPLRALDPQPVFVQTSRIDTNGKRVMTAYTFELLTRSSDPKKPMPPTTWAVTFVYPDRVHAAQVAAWRKRRAAEQAAEAERTALMQPPPAAPSTASNWRYGYRGSDSVMPDEAWDDGRTTFLRFNGNRRVPNIYRQLPDGHEAITAYATEPDATGTTLRVARTGAKWFLRDGDEAGCLFDLGPDPQGAGSTTVATASTLGAPISLGGPQ